MSDPIIVSSESAPAGSIAQISVPTENIAHSCPKLPTSDPKPQRRDLTARQSSALSLLALGKAEHHVCSDLQIPRRTLYHWKHKNPRFIAELNRRQAEIWETAAQRLRRALLKSVSVLSKQLGDPNQDTAFRAARACLPLIGQPRLAPTGRTDPDQILDQFLAANNLPPNTPPALLTSEQRADLLEKLSQDPDGPDAIS
jgi:hypothetical protein